MRDDRLPPTAELFDRLIGLGTDSVLSCPIDSRPMTVLDIGGPPLFLATEIGSALGYAPTSFKARLSEWSDQFRPDKDVVKLEGEALRALKDLGAVAKNTPAALLLTELLGQSTWTLRPTVPMLECPPSA